MEWLVEYGYIGLFIGAFIAATIVPFSSDVLLVGILVAGGNPYIAVPVATVGNWLGGLTSYWVGWLGKWEWIQKWTRVSREKLLRQKEKIDKYGSWLALLSWLPFIGDVFAVALGFYKVDFKRSAFFMFVGKAAKFVMWAVLYHYVRPHLQGMI